MSRVSRTYKQKVAHTKTTQQQNDLERALARACAAGLDIVGQGRMRNGNRFFLVPSASEPGKTHVVTSDTQHLHCDCSAGQRGTICQHRALAHEYLTHEAAKRVALEAEQVELALAECAAEDALHAAAKVLETTINGRGQRLGPRLKTDTKAFSIFR